MSRGKTQTKSTRAERNRLFQTTLREMRRRRAQRRGITSAYNSALEIVNAQTAGEWRAPDVKVIGAGWVVERIGHPEQDYESSRDKARAEAKRRNESPELTVEAVMSRFGYERAAQKGTIEKQWRKVT